MGFLDKAKKLAEQAREKAEPLIDKAAPHAGKMADKAGQQINKRTGGKYQDKIDVAEAKVTEFAEKRAARNDPDGPGIPTPPAADASGFPPTPVTPPAAADGPDFPPAPPVASDGPEFPPTPPPASSGPTTP